MSTDHTAEKLNILICDDDPIVLDRLRDISQNTLHPGWNAECFCATNPDLLMHVTDHIHIAVLDIELGDENGILLARRLLDQNPECHIVFVSGYPRYVSDVYDVPHIGMVLKDQLEIQLPKFLLRAAESVQACREQTLSVPVNRSVLRLNLSGIRYLERKEHITFVYLASGQEIRTRKKLGELLSQPCCGSLCRCHVSFAVNLRYVVDMQGRNFVLTTGELIPISRVYLHNARTSYYAFIQNSI